MGKLTDILNGHGGDFGKQWDSTAAAGEFSPLPRGEYVCHVTRGDLESSRSKGTPGFKIEFTVIEGEFAGRKVWHDCWLIPAALPHSKRDLIKLGIKSPDQMEVPLPRGIRCRVTVVVWKDNNGIETNKVRSFEVVGIDTPEADPFAPTALRSDESPPSDAAISAPQSPPRILRR